MKKVELTAEWILDKMTCGWMCDGRGNVSMSIDTVVGSGFVEMRLFELALAQMGVEFEEPAQVTDEDGNMTAWNYIFPIDSIAKDCPDLYVEMKKNDENNRIIRSNNHGNMLVQWYFETADQGDFKFGASFFEGEGNTNDRRELENLLGDNYVHFLDHPEIDRKFAENNKLEIVQNAVFALEEIILRHPEIYKEEEEEEKKEQDGFTRGSRAIAAD